MKLYDILYEKMYARNWFSYLAESREKEIQKLLTTDEQKAYYNSLIELQPSIPGKYLLWAARRIQKSMEISAKELHDYLLKFDKLVAMNSPKLDSKDINSFKRMVDLKSAVNNAGDFSKGVVSATQAKTQAKNDINLVYSDSKYLVVEPTSTGASCYYGSGTKWCISGKEDNQFNKYKSDGVIVVMIIDKEEVRENPMAKVAVAFLQNHENDNESNLINNYEIYDSTDQLRTIEDVWSHYPAPVLQAINTFFKKSIIPASKEEDLQNIQNLSPKQLVKMIRDYHDSFLIQRAQGQERGIAYIKYMITKLINSVSTHNQIRAITMFLETVDSDFGDSDQSEIKKFTSDLVVNRLKQLTSDMSPEDASKTIKGFDVPLSTMTYHGLGNLPQDPREARALFFNTSNVIVLNMLQMANKLLLGRDLVEAGTEAYIDANKFRDVMTFYHENEMKYNAEYLDIDRDIIYGFEKYVKYSTTIYPSITNDEYDEVAANMYRMIKRNELVLPEQDAKFPIQKGMVWYIPRK